VHRKTTVTAKLTVKQTQTDYNFADLATRSLSITCVSRSVAYTSLTKNYFNFK